MPYADDFSQSAHDAYFRGGAYEAHDDRIADAAERDGAFLKLMCEDVLRVLDNSRRLAIAFGDTRQIDCVDEAISEVAYEATKHIGGCRWDDFDGDFYWETLEGIAPLSVAAIRAL